MLADDPRATVWAVVVAAGTGARFGGVKQFALLAGRPVIDWSVEAARGVASGVVVVLPPERQGGLLAGADVAVPGGATRSASVRAGIAALPPEADVVVVHDAVRPLATVELFEAVVAAVLAGADAAVPGVPVSDTVKRVEGIGADGRFCLETLDRSRLVAVQTPQAFRLDALRRAHAGDPDATDDAALVEGLGGLVVVVDGDPRNLKLTHPYDLAVAEVLLQS